MDDQGRAPEHRVEISMPESKLPGVYADLVGVWHTPDTFVLDFSSFTEPPQLRPDDTGGVVVQPAHVVARVRVPPGQVFEIMKALERQLSMWERETGRSSGPPAAAE
jgi:uncharacterized protein DUF3467